MQDHSTTQPPPPLDIPETPPGPTKPSPLVNALGWYGTVAILAAYGLTSFGVIEQNALYQLLNLTGALGVGLVCWRLKTWQPFWLEVVWGAVAIISLVRLVT